MSEGAEVRFLSEHCGSQVLICNLAFLELMQHTLTVLFPHSCDFTVRVLSPFSVQRMGFGDLLNGDWEVATVQRLLHGGWVDKHADRVGAERVIWRRADFLNHILI